MSPRPQPGEWGPWVPGIAMDGTPVLGRQNWNESTQEVVSHGTERHAEVIAALKLKPALSHVQLALVVSIVLAGETPAYRISYDPAITGTERKSFCTCTVWEAIRVLNHWHQKSDGASIRIEEVFSIEARKVANE